MHRIKNLDGIPAFRASDGTWLREVYHPANDPVSLPYSLAHASLQEGEQSLPHVLDQDELYIIVAGEGEFRLDDEQFEVKAGDHLLVSGGVVQSLKNTGGVPLVFYCLVSPPWRAESDRLVSP